MESDNSNLQKLESLTKNFDVRNKDYFLARRTIRIPRIVMASFFYGTLSNIGHMGGMLS